MSPPDGIPPGRDAPGVGSLEIARQPWQGLRLFLLIPMSSLVFPEETKAPRRLVGFAKQQDTPGYDFTFSGSSAGQISPATSGRGSPKGDRGRPRKNAVLFKSAISRDIRE